MQQKQQKRKGVSKIIGLEIGFAEDVTIEQANECFEEILKSQKHLIKDCEVILEE